MHHRPDRCAEITTTADVSSSTNSRACTSSLSGITSVNQTKSQYVVHHQAPDTGSACGWWPLRSGRYDLLAAGRRAGRGRRDGGGIGKADRGAGGMLI